MNLGHDNNNLLVYKVKPSSKVQTEDTVRVIAIERQGTAEVEVQVWKTVGGNRRGKYRGHLHGSVNNKATAVDYLTIRNVTQYVFSLFPGVLQLMETGDVLKKDLLDNPDNYTLLATLDEGEFIHVFCVFFVVFVCIPLFSGNLKVLLL